MPFSIPMNLKEISLFSFPILLNESIKDSFEIKVEYNYFFCFFFDYPWKDDDLISTVEESAFVQRKYEKYFDMIIVNEDFDDTFRKVVETLDQMTHEDQWVPINWIYWGHWILTKKNKTKGNKNSWFHDFSIFPSI